MTEYDNEMTGTLWPNDKEDNPSRPDVTGKCQINGTEYRMAGWKKVSSNTGKAFYSIKFTDIEEVARESDPEGALEL